MNFINPRTDFAFKKIFGSETSRDLLLSFLNAILYQGRSVIQDVEIFAPYYPPRVRGIKEKSLTVRTSLASNKRVMIKLQVLHTPCGFERQLLHTVAQKYAVPISPAAEYHPTHPVIVLTITDFEMFPKDDAVISRFIVEETDFLIDNVIDDLELVFVELPKFHQNLDEIDNITDQWIYFLRYAQTLERIPTEMANVPALEQAFAMANQANLTREELEELEHQVIFIQDQRGVITKARKQGREEGREQERLAIARQLLPLLDDAAIAQTTGLAIAEIQRLRQA
jgi:predicted transposase/invertase (TIGR01784 family)